MQAYNNRTIYTSQHIATFFSLPLTHTPPLNNSLRVPRRPLLFSALKEEKMEVRRKIASRNKATLVLSIVPGVRGRIPAQVKLSC